MKKSGRTSGVILTNEEVRQLSEAGSEIHPMHWIKVDENAHLRRDEDYVSVSAMLNSRLVGCGKTSRQQKVFAQTLELVMWIRTMSFAVGAGPHPNSRMRFCEWIPSKTRN